MAGPVVIVLIGVAGVGKTTVGRELAAALHWSFRDADELHPPANVQRMSAGTPLTDAHRAEWLALLARLIAEHVTARRPLVLACSALKRAHRTALLAETAEPECVQLVYLAADPALIARRIEQRTGHFFPATLLADQLASLEQPASDEHVLSFDGAQPPSALVSAIRGALQL